MTRRFPVLACLALLAASTASAGSWLQDASETPAAPTASERLGMRAGSHEVQVFGGGFVGGMAYANDKTVPPLIAEPARMRIELDSGTSFGIGYSYQVHENWLIGGTLTRTTTEFVFEEPFDRAAEEALLLSRTVTVPSQGDELTEQRLLVVFGCGGDRDQGKRTLMGRVAARGSDRAWITSDNPRGEEPGGILRDILEGYDAVREPRATGREMLIDRREAIEAALADARTGDIVVVAGKGHEDYQLVGDKVYDLDDRIIIKEWINRDGNHE